jgi:putative Holliday junction resolvase
MLEDFYKRILGIDFGEKRIGLALSDPLSVFAAPYKTIPNNSSLMNELGKVITEKNIEKIILGIPSGKSPATAALSEKIKKFKEAAVRKFYLEVILWDEDYTSAVAKEKVLESVTKKSKRRNKGLLDSNSAAIILQEYLDQVKKNV